MAVKYMHEMAAKYMQNKKMFLIILENNCTLLQDIDIDIYRYGYTYIHTYKGNLQHSTHSTHHLNDLMTKRDCLATSK